ncbi:MAG: hypothetical protein LBJ36_09150 [Synergistaceae bacterium]|nr:hypothetical protein [Synergistaceae bacterium]
MLDEPHKFHHIERCKAAGVPVLGRADYIMVTTPATLKLPEFRGKSTLVYGFGDFDPTEIEPKTGYSLRSGEFVVGYAGSPTYKKLPYDFLDYVGAVVKLIPNAWFVMVGESDWKIVHPNVTFRGWVDDVYRGCSP